MEPDIKLDGTSIKVADEAKFLGASVRPSTYFQSSCQIPEDRLR